MLQSKYKFDKGGFNIALKYDPHWDSAKLKIFLVFDFIPSVDLENHELLSTDDSRVPVLNVIKYAMIEAKKYGFSNTDIAFRAFNFRYEKHLHLSTEQRKAKEQEFGARTIEAIEKYKPTHVLFLGLHAFRSTHECNYPANRIGWVEKVKFGNHECLSTLTFDLLQLVDYKKGVFSNHLRSIVFHLSYLLNSKNPFDISNVKPKPKYIESKKDFDSMMQVLKESKFVGLDTETRNLTVLSNAIYTIQFSSDKTEYGYVLALDHPQTPWTKDEIKYFKIQIRKFLTSKKGPILITMNGKFDLRVLRQCLKLTIIERKVWEIQAGEHLLNEDLVEWRSIIGDNTSYGGLRAILCLYCNDFYYRASFTKEDRSTTGEVKPNDPDFLKYASMDVCCLIPIMRMQIKRASLQDIKGHNYKPMFIRHMMHIMSDTVHVLSAMDECGSYIDMSYMNLLASKNSPFVSQLQEIKDTIYSFEEVKEANASLLKDAGYKAKGLFGNSVKQSWIFNLGKADHRVRLFLDILGLKSVETTTTGAPSIGKSFIKEYKDSNDIVEAYAKYQEVYKIYSSYIKSWYKLLTSTPDGSLDSHLRPSYQFFDVATGRISSQKPSLQVIPQHSKSAGTLKRAFIAPKGYLNVHYDYSAHEVRGWSIASNDMELGDAFREGQKLRQEFIANPSDEVAERMKKHGDIHVQNVHRFFGKWVTKKDPLRQAVKGVVFGTLYGKSAKTLGEDTKTGDLSALASQLNEAHHKGDTKLVRELKQKIAKLKAEDRTDYAQSIIDKMFATFKKGAAWTNKMIKCAKDNGYVYSPLGRIRHLMSSILVNPKDKQLINRQIRRGSNAPIQGFASELAVKGARLTMQAYYDELPVLCEMMGIEKSKWDLKVEISRMVHDASYYAVPYEMVLPFIQITQYVVTYGVAKSLDKEFGIKCTVEPEVEFEISSCDSDEGNTWNWDIKNLLDILDRSIIRAHELGTCDSIEETRQKVFSPWMNKKVVKYLDEKYPLLNVKLARKIYNDTSSFYRKKTDESNKATE